MRERLHWLVLWAALVLPAWAVADASLDERVRRLSHELRCLVCQNQTLADSHAPLAVELRSQLQDQLAHGASDQQVIDYMVARYGDFVRYRPPLQPSTWALWFGPLVLLLVGLAVWWARVRRAVAPEGRP